MTELIWDGKYDAQGKKVAPPRIALPFQTVETVNESAADRNRMQDLFASGRPTEWRNRLIWGAGGIVLASGDRCGKAPDPAIFPLGMARRGRRAQRIRRIKRQHAPAGH